LRAWGYCAAGCCGCSVDDGCAGPSLESAGKRNCLCGVGWKGSDCHVSCCLSLLIVLIRQSFKNAYCRHGYGHGVVDCGGVYDKGCSLRCDCWCGCQVKGQCWCNLNSSALES
jgi:hypothetical protein